MASLDDFEYKLKSHAVHVCHGQNADDRVARLYLLAQYVLGKVGVAPHGAVRYHHAFGESCRAAGVVDERQFVPVLLRIVVDVLLAEVFGIFKAEHLVQVLAGIGEPVCA